MNRRHTAQSSSSAAVESQSDGGSTIGDDDESTGQEVMVTVRLPLQTALRRCRLKSPATVHDLKVALGQSQQIPLADQVVWIDGAEAADEAEVVEGAHATLLSKEDTLTLSFLPQRLHSLLDFESLVDVVLDLKRPVVVHERGAHAEIFKREVPGELVTEEELASLAGHDSLGPWTSDNRSGIKGTLHRLCRVLDLDGTVVGLTLRIARPDFGLLEKMYDLMATRTSILLIGAPGTGKTTLLREMARVHGDVFGRRVFIVDTSCELAGFDRDPHEAVGHTSRRVKVPRRDQQHQVMVEAVQNHTPEILVIDEIGTEAEVQAALSIAARGVSLVATAHATDLQQAIWNPTLKPLFGDMDTVPVSDAAAKLNYGGRKLVTQRKHPCPFDRLIETSHSGHLTIHDDLQSNVDRLLAQNPPDVRHFSAPAPGPAHPRTPPPAQAQAQAGAWGSGAASAPSTSTSPNPNPEPGTGKGYPRGAAVSSLTPERMRYLRSSGGAYRLCFDGGVDNPHTPGVSPGGAGAVLTRLCAGGRRREVVAKWHLYEPDSTVDQMEYAGLLLGLVETKRLLDSLSPPLSLLLIEGDSKFVVGRVGNASSSGSTDFTHLHAALAANISGLDQEAHRLLGEMQISNPVQFQWRPRGKNKQADALTHHARTTQTNSSSNMNDTGEWLQLLKREWLVPTRWQVASRHPLLDLENLPEVPHPHHAAGYVGLQLYTQSGAVDSFSVSIVLEGQWNRKDSLLFGIVRQDVDCSTSINEPATKGFFLSPKSGHVVGIPQMNYMLEGLRLKKETDGNSRHNRNDAGLEPTGVIRSGTRWALEYSRGILSFYCTEPGGSLQLLGLVNTEGTNAGAADANGPLALVYRPVVLFKGRSGGAATPAQWCPKGRRGQARNRPFCGGPGHRPSSARIILGGSPLSTQLPRPLQWPPMFELAVVPPVKMGTFILLPIAPARARAATSNAPALAQAASCDTLALARVEDFNVEWDSWETKVPLFPGLTAADALNARRSHGIPSGFTCGLCRGVAVGVNANVLERLKGIEGVNLRSLPRDRDSIVSVVVDRSLVIEAPSLRLCHPLAFYLSNSVRTSENPIRHPRQERGFAFAKLGPVSRDNVGLAVQILGCWTHDDSALIGFVRQDADLKTLMLGQSQSQSRSQSQGKGQSTRGWQHRQQADAVAAGGQLCHVGFFFSMKSRTVVGMDGSNLPSHSWSPGSYQKASNLTCRSGEAWGICLRDGCFNVFHSEDMAERRQRLYELREQEALSFQWWSSGPVQWVTGIRLPQAQYQAVIAFKPRSHNPPVSLVGERRCKGGGKGGNKGRPNYARSRRWQSAVDPPAVHVLSDSPLPPRFWPLERSLGEPWLPDEWRDLTGKRGG